MINYNTLLLVSLTCLSAGFSQAASTVSDDFDTGLGSWVPNTTQTTNTHSPNGGNPNGYLSTDNLSGSTSFGAIGAVNTTPDYSGVFADGLWNISVDLSFINGDFTDSWLRFRFQDSTANGWHISLEDTNFFDSTWQSYSVAFDTTWDDATAMANGWFKEADGPTVTPSFTDLWDDVYTSEVRILGADRMIAGIDNYNVRNNTVPEPTTVLLFGIGLLGLSAMRRKKTNEVSIKLSAPFCLASIRQIFKKNYCVRNGGIFSLRLRSFIMRRRAEKWSAFRHSPYYTDKRNGTK